MRAPATTVPRVDIVHLDTTGRGRGAGPVDEAGHLRALRLRSADALERAFGFLEAQSDEWARARSRVLCGAEPSSQLIARLESCQQPDGSFPLGTLVSGGGLGFPPIELAGLSPAGRALVGTLEALLVAADAGLLHGAWLERAIRFLERHQSGDGAFRLQSPRADAPVALREPGREQADVFWTGMVAGLLGRTPLSRADTLERAGAFLAERFTPDAVENDGYSALMAYSLYFTNVGGELSDEALQWCGRALEKGFRSRRHDAVATMRVLLSCDAQAMPGAEFDAVELLERLLEEQARDGGFAELSAGGPSARTTQTFDAMFAIVRLCSALAPDSD